MIPRYMSAEIARIWSDENKTALWQDVELAVIEARRDSGEISQGHFEIVERSLLDNPIDLKWWLEREKTIGHDLNAFLEERVRFIPPSLQDLFHKQLTSYDTEEPAFALILQASASHLDAALSELLDILRQQTLKYRRVPMMARTHGQYAEVQSFGLRFVRWYADLMVDKQLLDEARERLHYSKLSGAVGNCTGIDPELERLALAKLGLKPFYGASQIMPREIYAPLASALCQLVQTLHKIAMAIRLGARSGNPIYQEPFRKGQKGSSAMPGKKNTIATEQMEGLASMALGYLAMIMNRISTWEERAIEQSSVERVAWPDLFHVAVRVVKVITGVLADLKVYPQNMLREIIESNGCYAASAAQSCLKTLGTETGLFEAETAYRLVQLAAFNAFEDQQGVYPICENLQVADEILANTKRYSTPRRSIKNLLLHGRLRPSDEVPLTAEEIAQHSRSLRKIFKNPEWRQRWEEVFSLVYLLRNEPEIYRQVLGKKA